MQEAIRRSWRRFLTARTRPARAGEGDMRGGRLRHVVVAGCREASGAPSAALWAASAAVLSVLVNAKKLIRDGVIDDDTKNNSFHLNESATSMDATFLAWNYMGNRDAERLVFHYLTSTAQVAAASRLSPLQHILRHQAGRLLRPRDHHPPHQPAPHMAAADETCARGALQHADDAVCMSFLDAQPGGSVVYVAFGSISVMTGAQLRELALGLEPSGRPFLWVVRPEQAGKLPAGFADAIAGLGKGKLVGWAPQEQVASADGGGLVMKEKVVELLDRIFRTKVPRKEC
ncbi:hypothetical protein ZWY2020_047877 [Hordeum vulgare]|nr:hypothetical protein ZWY2020_047877 [Hordeum vulgare]